MSENYAKSFSLNQQINRRAMKHLILTLLLMFSTTVHAFKIVEYKNAEGFMPFGISQECRDPDSSLKDVTDSTVFLCAAFRAGNNTYLAFAELETMEVLELYRYDMTIQEYVLVSILEPIDGDAI